MNSIDPIHASSGTESKESLILEALQEYQAAMDGTEPPDREALLRKYSAIAGDLAECLDNLDFLENVAPQIAEHSGSDVLTEPTAPRAAIHSRLGDFRIIREIGRGGMGVVYEAEQTSMARRVALKVLPFAAILDQKVLQRFRSEAQIAGQLVHQSIVPVYSVGCERNVHYYAMQFIDGLTLAELIQELKQSNVAHRDIEETEPSHSSQSNEARKKDRETRSLATLSTSHSNVDPRHIRSNALLMAQVAQALDYAHGQGVIHRDIKPSNLMVDGEGKIWVTDFGLAHIEVGPSITMTGDFLGTLRYMSPEQALAQRVVIDHRTDIYSLGLTFFELFTHEPAFAATDRQELLRQISFEEPVRPRRLNKVIPVDLETILLKAIEKNPADRYQTAADLAADLQRFADDRPIQARRPTVVQKTNKWCRRHRSLVATVLAATFVLMAFAAVGSSLLAVRLNEVAEQEKAVTEKVSKANAKLETANYEYARVLASSYVDKAQALCEDGEIATGMLWLARALGTAPPEAVERRRAIRSSLSAWHQQLPSLRLMVEQDEPLHAVALSADGRTLYTGGSFGTLRAFDATSGQMVAISSGYQSPAPILAIAISPEGKHIATACDDGKARVWNADTLMPIGPPIDFHEDDVVWRGRDVVFSADGKRVTCGGEYGYYPGGRRRHFRGKVIVWDIESQRVVKTIRSPGGVLRLRDTPKGLLAALRVDRHTCQLWNVETDKAVGPPLVERGQFINCLAISPDGTRLGVAGFVTIEVWDAGSGELINRFGSSGNIFSLEFNESGSQLLSGGLDQAARLWDVDTGTSAAMPLRHLAPVSIAAFSADYTRIVSGTNSGGASSPIGQARVWDVAMKRPDSRPLQHEDEIRAVTFARQGLRVLTLTDESQHVHQLSGGDNMVPVGQPFSTSGPVDRMSTRFSEDGSRFAYTVDSALEVRDAGTCELLARTSASGAIVMAFSPDGRYLLTGGRYGHVIMREADSLKQVGDLFLSDFVPAVDFSGDGKHFVTGCFDGTVRLWDAASCKQIGDVIQHVSEVKCLAYHPKVDQVFVGCADGSARLWDLGTRTPIGPSLQHKHYVRDVAYSPDGTLVVSVSEGGKICFWDSTTLQPVGPPLTHRRSGPRVSFSPDSQQIVADQRSMGEVWDLSTTPLSGTAEDIRRWTQLVTGWAMDEIGQVQEVGMQQWATERNQLIGKRLQLAGLPQVDEHFGDSVRRTQPPRVLAAKALRNRAWDDAIRQVDHSIAESRPRWKDHIIRGRALAATGLTSEADQSFELALQSASDDFTRAYARMERRRSFVLANRAEDAAADLVELIASRPEGSPSWIMTDWWTSGPYQGQLIGSDPLEKIQVATSLNGASPPGTEGTNGFAWSPRPALNDFQVDEGRTLDLPAVGPSVIYTLAYVYSTDEQDVTLFLGYNDGARVWWNGQRICSSEFAFGTLPDSDLRLVTLRRGWNTLLAKVSNDGGLETKLYTRISADAADRAFASASGGAAAGRWTEAAESLMQGCRLCEDPQKRLRRLVTLAGHLKHHKLDEDARLMRFSGEELAAQAFSILENESDPDDPAGFLFLSIIHHELGNAESVARCYQRALSRADVVRGAAAREFERFRGFTRALLDETEPTFN